MVERTSLASGLVPLGKQGFSGTQKSINQCSVYFPWEIVVSGPSCPMSAVVPAIVLSTRALSTQTRPGPPPRPLWMGCLNHVLGNSCTMNSRAYQLCWSLGRCQHPVCMREHPGYERDEASSWETKEDKDVHCKPLGWESKQDEREHSLQVLHVLSFYTVSFPMQANNFQSASKAS